ncbi:hypothetical protein [Streptomyces sp. Root1310]|uniref:hypothetical protein n=1 Tax=Streptomyces sp. Root1310 TaxID=1736452 RepID=UPI000ADDE0F5|nr:hypothetical protein [Streptomyces sp. Root1310]
MPQRAATVVVGGGIGRLAMAIAPHRRPLCCRATRPPDRHRRGRRCCHDAGARPDLAR